MAIPVDWSVKHQTKQTKSKTMIQINCDALKVEKVLFHFFSILNDKVLIISCMFVAAQLIHSMNPTVDPCDNFFEYACGNWNKKNVIPEDKSSYNTFEKLHDELQITLKGRSRLFQR